VLQKKGGRTGKMKKHEKFSLPTRLHALLQLPVKRSQEKQSWCLRSTKANWFSRPGRSSAGLFRRPPALGCLSRPIGSATCHTQHKLSHTLSRGGQILSGFFQALHASLPALMAEELRSKILLGLIDVHFWRLDEIFYQFFSFFFFLFAAARAEHYRFASLRASTPETMRG
jgi:hypothetical protein